MTDSNQPAGWYPDSSNPQQQRYWDGEKWTDQTAAGSSPTATFAPPVSNAGSTNGLAIASFVVALLTFCGLGSLLGVIFGHVALGQIKRSNQRGRGFAIAGLVLGYLGIAAIALIIILAAVASDDATTGSDVGGVKSGSSNQSNPPQNDVKISACREDSLGFMEAEITVTNHSSKRSNYLIEVAFEGNGGSVQLGTGTGLVNGLEPDQVAKETAGSLEEATGAFECRITDVNRFAS